MRIVIGVDGSPCSKAALAFLRKLDLPLGSRVVVVSAVKSPVLAHSDTYVPALAAAGELVEDMTEAYQELASRAELELRDHGFATEARVLNSDPREAIVRVAQEERADLVVVGSHGRTGIVKLLMGSVAAHVVAHAPCSVLVVKQDRSAT